VAKPTQIRQGGDLPFSFNLDGDSLEGRTCTIYVKQHIKDISTITREIPLNDDRTAFEGFLTSAETMGLSVGLWHIFADMVDILTGQDRQIASGTVRFEVGETVVDSVVPATIINSVSLGTVIPSGGNFARFNFTAGPSFTIGQAVTIAGYTTNTLYNDSGLIVNKENDFIEITSNTTFLAIKFGTDESGGSISS